MTELEKLRTWLKTYPGEIPTDFQIDYTSEIPQNAGLFPTGNIELSRVRDLLGSTTVTNQLNFGLYTAFEKPTDIDEAATKNAEWIMDFQRWVQEQSINRIAPNFGNIDFGEEKIQAQNGQFFGDKEQGIGVYMVNINITFKQFYSSPRDY